MLYLTPLSFHELSETIRPNEQPGKGGLPMPTWRARIRLTGGNQQEVTVEADTQVNAKRMIQAMYGQGSIISGPHLVR